MLLQHFTIILDAVLRPARFIAFLSRGWRAVLHATLLVLALVGLFMIGLALILGRLGLLDGVILLAAGVAGVALAVMVGVVSGLMVSMRYGGRVGYSFSLLHTILVITPTAMLFLVIIYIPSLRSLQQDAILVLLLSVVSGIWLSSAIMVSIAVGARDSESNAVRWVIGVGALILFVQFWVYRSVLSELALLGLVGIGCSLGMLRWGSYLWEAPLGLALALAARMGIPARRLLPLHPARYDELALLPLPGLPGLLTRAYVHGGCGWLLRIARHPTQHRAAWRAVVRLVQRGQHAHPLLLGLSLDREGIALLQAITAGTPRCPRLIVAYAALTRPIPPEAWPSLVVRQQRAFAESAQLPGGRALLDFLATSAAIMRADRWRIAAEHLHTLVRLDLAEHAPLRAALLAFQSWADTSLPAPTADHQRANEALQAALLELDAWPTHLLGVVGEQLYFLRCLERRCNQKAGDQDQGGCHDA